MIPQVYSMKERNKKRDGVGLWLLLNKEAAKAITSAVLEAGE